MSYNLLPKNIKNRFQIIYSELVCDNITIFKNRSEKWGALIETKKFGIFANYQYLVTPVYNSIGFNKIVNLIEAVKYENDKWNRDENTFYFFSIDGKLKWKSEKGTSVSIDRNKYIISCKDKKYGLLDADFNTLILPTYDKLISLEGRCFIACKNHLYGIIDLKESIILDFNYSDIFTTAYNSKAIVKDLNGKYFSFDFKKDLLISLPYNKILPASSNSYKAPSVGSFNQFKSIINCVEIEYEDLEMKRYKGKWGIINADGSIKIPNEYDYIDFLRNPQYFKVCKGDLQFRIEEDDSRLIAFNAKWGVVDINNNIIVPIEYDWVNELEATIWAVYNGGEVFYNDDYQEEYWTIKGGKLGVYNLNKLITPIEYNSVKTSWFRVKDYIFVQNGNEYFDENTMDYHVYTFEGEKIEKNKPNPKKYFNNG